jgi:hypothetical protein
MPPTPDAIGVNCATHEWSPRVLYVNHSYDARSGISHHCPKSRREACDDQLFLILPWPIPTIVSAETQLYEANAKPNYVSNHREVTTTIPNHDYTATEPR